MGRRLAALGRRTAPPACARRPRYRTGTPSPGAPRAARGAAARSRRRAACAPSRERVAPRARRATLPVFRSCDPSSFSFPFRRERTVAIPSPTIPRASGTSTAARCGRSFWASTMPPTTAIAGTSCRLRSCVRSADLFVDDLDVAKTVRLGDVPEPRAGLGELVDSPCGLLGRLSAAPEDDVEPRSVVLPRQPGGPCRQERATERTHHLRALRDQSFLLSLADGEVSELERGPDHGRISNPAPLST